MSETWRTGTLLPLEKNLETGAFRWAMPLALQDIISALTLPGDVWTGQVQPGTDEYYDRAAGFGLELAPGANTVSRLVGDTGSLGMFAGRTAGAPIGYEEALERLSSGENPTDVWRRMGWAQGPRGDAEGLRYEIPDQAAQLYTDRYYTDAFLPDVLTHPELFEAYPELSGLGMDFLPPDGTGNYGQFNYDTGKISVHNMTGDREQVRSTLMHEIQHAIQALQGWQGGGNPTWTQSRLNDIAAETVMASPEYQRLRDVLQPMVDAENLQVPHGLAEPGFYTELLNRAPDDIWEQAYPLTEAVNKYWNNTHDAMPEAFDLYRALGGEVEARNVQTRLTMPPEFAALHAPHTTANWQNPANLPAIAPNDFTLQNLIKLKGAM